MDLLSHLHGRCVYLDSNIFIYYLEGFDEFEVELLDLFRAIEQGEMTAVTSLLTLAEVLARPFRENDNRKAEAYRGLLTTRRGFVVEPITEEILIEAARLRSVSRLRLPDAIHVATAVKLGASSYLTNDHRLRGVEGIETTILADFSDS